jgi:hypothetical protein
VPDHVNETVDLEEQFVVEVQVTFDGLDPDSVCEAGDLFACACD